MMVDLEKWMSSVDDSVNLMSLNIPGTHDCVTQYVQLSHFAKCQDKNILDQLKMGIRALDIRVQPKGDRLGMVHGIAKAYNSANPLGEQMDLAYVLDYCYRFLEKNPHETIIFQFKNDSNKEMEICFDNLYRRYIKEYPDKWYTENRIPKLGEVRGKIVLVRRCKMYENSAEYSAENAGIDFSRWVEQDEAVPEALTLETYSLDNARFIIQDRFKYKPEPRWSECIKPFLDNQKVFDGEYIICYFSTAGGIKGPESNAKYINPRLLDYPLEKGKYYGIMYLDFPSEEIAEKIILTN